MNKYRLNRLFSLFLITTAYTVYSQSTIDTSKIMIKKVSNIAPGNFNFSDVTIKLDNSTTSNYMLRIIIGVPAPSKISARITDSSNLEIVNLFNEKTIAPGSYYIKWEMTNFPEGKYWCEFNAPEFVYRKDFYIYSIQNNR